MRRRAMFSTLLSGDNGGGNEGGGDYPNMRNYLTFEALEDGFTAKLSRNACEYCVNGSENWVALDAETETPAINAGQIISFRAEITPVTSYGVGTFTFSKNVHIKGNPLSMIFKDNANEESVPPKYALCKMFYNQTKVCSVDENFLPFSQLGNNCYSGLFQGCSNLLAAPKLPALEAVSRCYDSMFRNCTNLLVAPELPATTLGNYCYNYMFAGCQNLTSAPVLPALSVSGSGYYYMFSNCRKVAYIKAMFLEYENRGITGWVGGVASAGTFVKNAAATWDVVGADGVPSGWTIEYATE